jgi:cytochrome c
MTVLAALSTGRAILYGLAAGLAVVLAAGAVLAGRRRPRRPPEIDIPPGMRPGPSDPDLEKPVLEKLMAWGLLLVVIMAIWLPTVFLRENDTNKADTVTFIEESVERGRLTTLPGTEENQLGFNCERCHGPGLHGGENVFNGTVVAVPNLQTVCGGAAFGHAQINNLQDVINTIAQGRPNTDMPSWSVRFAGAMDDQQIQDVVNYILSIQKEPKDQNICVNPPKASASPSASSSGSPSPAGSASPSASSSP